MRTTEHRARPLGATALVFACVLSIFLLAVVVSSDQPIEPAAQGSLVVQQVADDVPLGVLPEVATVTLVLLVLALVVAGITAPDCRPARIRRGRAPPVFSESA